MNFSKKEIVGIVIVGIIIGIIIGIVFGFVLGKRAEYDNLKNTIEITKVYDDESNPELGHVEINWAPAKEVDDGHWTDTDIEIYDYYK